jgi:hypothetical protein
MSPLVIPPDHFSVREVSSLAHGLVPPWGLTFPWAAEDLLVVEGHRERVALTGAGAGAGACARSGVLERRRGRR